MKILKLPISNVINCCCGCSFEWDTNDVITSDVYSYGQIGVRVSVRCPFCYNEHILHTNAPTTPNITWY